MRVERMSRIFNAFGDPTRAAMLQRLAQGPATAGQLAALFPISRPAVSQHLRVMREAGLVRTTSSGRNVWYELAGRSLLEATSWLDRLTQRWTNAPTIETRVRKRQEVR